MQEILSNPNRKNPHKIPTAPYPAFYGKDAKKFSMKSADLKRDLSEGYVFFE